MNLVPDIDLSRSQRPAADAFCLPPECYTHPDVTQREIEQLFRNGWIGVGRSSMVSRPGDYIALDIAGQNIILLRDRDGALRAFANTCRHRSARLVDGTGNCRGIRCPFHSWFYSLDGRLVAAPQMESALDFEKDEFGLVAYNAAERAGFAFVCLAQSAPDLDARLGDFASVHADWPLDALVSVRRRDLEVACNWKLFLDVFNEYYHLPFVHPNSIDSIYAAPEQADTVSGAFATQFGRTDGTGGLLEGDQNHALPDMPGLGGQATQGARYTWVFPNMTFAANRDALWCYEAYPVAPDRCHVVQTACFHPEIVGLPDFETHLAAYLDRL
ncbi:MAG: aromatic ring-hydroxylating dioxygenase subunit alpha, partial [Pseudomonadota bacterium]